MLDRDHLEAVRAISGYTPADFRAYAIWQGYVETNGRLKPSVEPGIIIADLKRDFGLDASVARAILVMLQGRK